MPRVPDHFPAMPGAIRPTVRPACRSSLLALLLTALSAFGLEIQNANLRFELSADGRPVSLRDATGEEMLNLRAPGRGIFLTAPNGSLIP